MQSLLRRLLQRSYVQVILGAIALLAVVALNGRPSVFTDTDDYYAQGRGAEISRHPSRLAGLGIVVVQFDQGLDVL